MDTSTNINIETKKMRVSGADTFGDCDGAAGHPMVRVSRGTILQHHFLSIWTREKTL